MKLSSFWQISGMLKIKQLFFGHLKEVKRWDKICRYYGIESGHSYSNTIRFKAILNKIWRKGLGHTLHFDKALPLEVLEIAEWAVNFNMNNPYFLEICDVVNQEFNKIPPIRTWRLSPLSNVEIVKDSLKDNRPYVAKIERGVVMPLTLTDEEFRLIKEIRKKQSRVIRERGKAHIASFIKGRLPIELYNDAYTVERP